MSSLSGAAGMNGRRKAVVLSLGMATVAAGWLLAALLSPRPAGAFLPFVFAQAALAALLFGLLVADSERWTETGPGTMAFLAVHGLVLYGLSNVVPVFFRDLRSPYLKLLMERIPAAGMNAYTAATIAAVGLVAGAALGAGVVLRASDIVGRHRPERRPVPWLPGAGVSAASLVVLVVLVLAGTARFGLGFGVTLTEEVILRFSVVDQLLFHGLIPFLPLGPGLAAAVYVQRRRTGLPGSVLLVLVGVFFVTMIAVWRMRSVAMIAAALPVGVLALSGRLRLRRWLVPAILLFSAIYAGVTALRISDVSSVVLASQERNPAAREFLEAAGRKGSDETIVERTLFDGSYRTAGLEGVAALVEAQESGRLPLQESRVTVAGFMQALPARIRPQPEYPLKVKTAPSVLGIFGEGDWVTTLLAEAVMDFGVWGTVLYGLFAGFLIALVERTLLLLGSYPALDVLLVLRYAFLCNLLIIGADISSLTFTLLKATVGFLGLLVLVSALVHVLRAFVRDPSPGFAGKGAQP